MMIIVDYFGIIINFPTKIYSEYTQNINCIELL